MSTINAALYAILGGIIPALIWLFYWLSEDKKNPEPKGLLLKAFMYGILMVPIAFILQWLVNVIFMGKTIIEDISQYAYLTTLIILIIWATIEEVLKYLAAHKAGLSKIAYNEPIDAVIYLITTALGFSAFENFLFLLTPFLEGNVLDAIIISNLRFVGASLLHVVASASIGIFIAFSYYRNAEIKKRYLISGFITAITLHTLFNSFIIKAEQFTLIGLITVWIATIVIVILLEKIKKLTNKNHA
jgi:RsiW-degrading membrane proteinase PrsW (M82 family)